MLFRDAAMVDCWQLAPTFPTLQLTGIFWMLLKTTHAVVDIRLCTHTDTYVGRLLAFCTVGALPSRMHIIGGTAPQYLFFLAVVFIILKLWRDLAILRLLYFHVLLASRLRVLALEGYAYMTRVDLNLCDNNRITLELNYSRSYRHPFKVDFSLCVPLCIGLIHCKPVHNRFHKAR